MSIYSWSPFRRVIRVKLLHLTYNQADRLLKLPGGMQKYRIAKEEDDNEIFFGDWDKLMVYLEEVRIERTWLGKLIDKLKGIE